jgi:hypothetical protein
MERDNTHTVEGIEFKTYADGCIMWSADWCALCDLANAGDARFAYVSGGPETYGHTDIYYRASA